MASEDVPPKVTILAVVLVTVQYDYLYLTSSNGFATFHAGCSWDFLNEQPVCLQSFFMVTAPKSQTPPPTYAESVPPPAMPYTHPSPSAQVPTVQFVGHSWGHGPTPILQQQTLLPYYDPRSVYSVHEASSRARWRFLGAIAWAYGLIALVFWAGIADSRVHRY